MKTVLKITMDELIKKLILELTSKIFYTDRLIIDLVKKESAKRNQPLNEKLFVCHICNTRIILINYANVTENMKKYCCRCESKMTYFKMFGFSMPERN